MTAKGRLHRRVTASGVGVGRGASEGVLIKDAAALELMEKVDTLVIDKTGTLTEGWPRLVIVEAVNGATQDDLLRFAASVESAGTRLRA